MTKKREWRLAALAAFLGAAAIIVCGAQAQGNGTPTGGTQCYIGGHWVFVPSGGCPPSGGGGGSRNTVTREEAREYSRYVAAYNRALKLYKQAIVTNAARGLSLCQSALSSTDEALQNEPGDGNALTLRRQIVSCVSSCNGQLAVQRGDFEQGISFFREAESEYPESNALWEKNIAWAESMRQQAIANANAKAEADRAAQKKAQIDALWARGAQLLKDSDFKAAEAIWRQIIALDPQNSAAYFNLGLALRFQARYTEAETALRQAIQLNPKDSASEVELGYVLHGQQRYGEVETAFRKAIEIDPKDSEAEQQLGYLLETQKRYAEAEAAFRKALELSPGDKDTQDALQSLIDLQAKARQQEQASPQGQPAFAQVVAHGQFYFITRDGHKLTGQEADKVPLEEGGRLITGSDGHVQMLLPDETVFTVGPNSDLVIDQFVYDQANDAATVTAKLSKGIFRWVTGKIARKDPAKMKVILPAGDLGIRGTDFEAIVEADGSGVVKLYSGQLQITEEKTGRIFLLNAGETVTFGSDGIFGRPN